MEEDLYYKQIKNLIIDTETTIRVKDYSKNRVIVENYYEIGKLIVEAQGGVKRAKYGEGLIKKFSNKLVLEIDKKYNERTLRNIRKFYLITKNDIWKPLVSKLNWSHFIILMRIQDESEMLYYANKCIDMSLSKRELEDLIKSKEYENLSEETKLKLIENKKPELVELVKDPIIINNPNNIDVIKEKTLAKLIMEDIYYFLKQFGNNYHFVGNEYKVKIGNRYNYMDILLYNKEYKAYVVIELKIGELRKQDIGQIMLYMSYVDNNLTDNYDNKTIGIILCHKNNKLIMEYCSDSRIIAREYIFN